MKKLFCFFLLTALLLTLVPAAYAAGHGRNRQQPECTVENGICPTSGGCVYADEDGDGICDNRPEECGTNYVDADGDGVCDNRSKAFTDENSDGVCDNREAGCGRQSRGHHNGQRRGCGRR